MIAGLVIGLLVGLAAGIGLGWVLFRRPAEAASEATPVSPDPVAATVAAPDAVEPKPVRADPAPADAPPDDDLKRTLDATQGLLDDLESRYRKGGPRPPQGPHAAD